jgi:prevent-host-death family protein
MSATEAARQFADLLDSVERDGETIVVERRGKPVASISPASTGNGKQIKDLLASAPRDPEWAAELEELRRSFPIQERSWGD